MATLTFDQMSEIYDLGIEYLLRDDIEVVEKEDDTTKMTHHKCKEKEERCHVCGGIKRFGICQDCGTDI